jgi:hypothetical protein
MDEVKARAILGDWIQPYGALRYMTDTRLLAWSPGDLVIAMDVILTLEQLQAITWWVEHKQ